MGTSSALTGEDLVRQRPPGFPAWMRTLTPLAQHVGEGPHFPLHVCRNSLGFCLFLEKMASPSPSPHDGKPPSSLSLSRRGITEPGVSVSETSPGLPAFWLPGSVESHHFWPRRPQGSPSCSFAICPSILSSQSFLCL